MWIVYSLTPSLKFSPVPQTTPSHSKRMAVKKNYKWIKGNCVIRCGHECERASGYVCVCLHVLNCVQLFCNPMDCNLLGSSVHGISQASILECVAVSSSNEAALLVHKSRVMDNSWIPSHSRLQTAAFYNGLMFIPTQLRWIGHITNFN